MKTENPWETKEGKAIWKTKSSYFAWLRGALRKLWSAYPLRQEWKKRQMRPLTDDDRKSGNFHTSTKNIGQCFYCENWFPASKLEVDHKIASDGCTSQEEAEKFLWYCGGQTGDSWVLACKPCHKIKTHAERKGLSFDEALIEKKAIEMEEVLTLAEIKALLEKHELPNTSKPIRRNGLIELLTKGLI